MEIEQITLSDTIQEFMTKCNLNFNRIASGNGGPQGRPGENGRTGATGPRGNSIRYVNVIDDGDSEFTVAEANYSIYGMDFEEGDVVIFSNGWLGSIVSIESDGSEYIPIVGNLSDALIGPRGERGEQGEQASDQFEISDSGNYLELKNEYSGLVVARWGPNVDRPIIVDSVKYYDGNDITTSMETQGSEFKIRSENTISMESGDIYIGRDSTDDVTINGNNSVLIGTDVNSVNIDNVSGIVMHGAAEFDDYTKFQSGVSFGNENAQTVINGDRIDTSSIKSDSLTIGITAPASQANKNLTLDSNGFNFVGKFKITPANVTTSLPIRSDSTIKVKSGNEYVVLDCPKYTMMLYPDGTDVPQYWMPLNKNIYITGANKIDASLQNGEISDTTLYFKFGDFIYKVDNYSSKIYETLIIESASQSGSGTVSANDVIEYISGKMNTGNLSLGINAAGATGFTQRPQSSNTTQLLANAISDYSEMVVDGDIENALVANELPERTASAYAGFLKNMLKVRVEGQNNYYKDMTDVFTLIRKTQSTTNVSFIFSRPEAPAGFMWIFKNA